MNVLNRKMFVNRDARRKLANMGGILASSPELMQTAQRFQTGGPATVPGFVPFKTKTVIMGDPKGGTLYDLYSDGSAILVSTGTRIDPNNASNQKFLQMLQRLPDVTNTSISQPIEETDIPKLDTTPVLNEQLQSKPNTVRVTGDENYTPTAAELDQQLLDMGAPDKRFDFVSMDEIYGDREDLKPMTRTEAMVKSGQLPDSSKIEDKPGTLMDDLYRLGIDATNVLRAGGIDYGNRPVSTETADRINQRFVASPLDSDMSTATANKSTSTDTDKVETATNKGYYVSPGVKAIKGFFGFGDDKEKEEKKKTKKTKEVEIADDADADLDKPGERGFTPGEDDTIAALEEIATSDKTPEKKVEGIREKIFGPNVDSQTAIAQYQTKFNDILGEDRDLNEEKWHTLAMIGFAIAAGEDPNALTNIANGLLEGTKMAREDRATRQARKDKINMLALEQFFADERLRKELEGRETVANIQASARSKDYLETSDGRAALSLYKSIVISPDPGGELSDKSTSERIKAFENQIGKENADKFFEETGFPRAPAEDDKRTLDDIT